MRPNIKGYIITKLHGNYSSIWEISGVSGTVYNTHLHLKIGKIDYMY